MSDIPIRSAGDNPTLLWGMTSAERLRRIGRAQAGPIGQAVPAGGAIVANADYVFDPAWLRSILRTPATVLTRDGRPALAFATDARQADAVAAAMTGSGRIPPDMTIVAQETADALVNDELRKRERPFMARLTPEAVPALERASYAGAYKGVTDLLTKYLWPEWALVLTRLCARAGISPNQVTIAGILLCIAATFLFAHGHYWAGMALGLIFMVLDTVDGKLARCTITSSRLGDVLDHGVDLVHPPFWWYFWGVGLYAYGRPLADDVFLSSMAAIVGGYVVQRLIEGAFIARYRMHIHVWRPFDSRFRLVTARRNPNMVILFASVAIGRPDWGLVAVAGWTILSLAVHCVQLLQAAAISARGGTIRSWLG
ncbi:MAG: CDP-alcohol phosphatidyltransferase family protein [Sphingomonas fennica]